MNDSEFISCNMIMEGRWYPILINVSRMECVIHRADYPQMVGICMASALPQTQPIWTDLVWNDLCKTLKVRAS